MDEQTPLAPDTVKEITQAEPTDQTSDTSGHDENGDGLKGGQSTVDQFGDVLGI